MKKVYDKLVRRVNKVDPYTEITEMVTSIVERKTIMDENKSTFELIYDVVKQIPKGKVATYGQVAALAGNRRWSRVVGYALHANPDPQNIPCHRVVNRLGEVSKAFAFGGENRQIALLQNEGVKVQENRVDLSKYRWNRVTIEMME